MMRDFAFPTIAAYHIANAKSGGGGTNIVNVILVDFRGYDTFGEITVLGIAALVIYALTEALLKPGPANDRLLAWVPDQSRGGRPPSDDAGGRDADAAAGGADGRGLHLPARPQPPGGGFIAGLIVAIALIMQYMASGFGWSNARKRVEYHTLIARGVLVAAATGLGALVQRAAVPDLGLRLCPPCRRWRSSNWPPPRCSIWACSCRVLGAVMLALASISRMAVRAGGTVNASPFGIDPSRTGGV